MTLPLLLLVLDAYPLRRLRPACACRRGSRGGAVLGLGAAAAIVALLAQGAAAP